MINSIQFLGNDLIHLPELLELLTKFASHLIVLLIIVRWLYYTVAKRKDYLFSYILIGSVVFLLCYILESVSLQLGFALGLFAIFGIIRYRTMQIQIKEMTYLFLVIGISVINSLAHNQISYVELLFTNMLIIFITWGLERAWLLKHETSKFVDYERIELIRQENRDQLIEDLEERTGIKKINRVEIGAINFIRDTVNIKIFYFAKDDVIFNKDTNQRNKDSLS
ncbi:MAG: DUF4956 domain-containing protein [Candidatus Heimdallarchaeota archaeon]|nr:DUF4956 domain-containing protein [Candidatus Heimdallarchaeota archaeon]